MNHATRFAKLGLLLVLVAALAMTGCGSDGLSAADQARIDDAEAAAAAAAAEKAAAEEAARLAAEQAAAEEAARLAAEEAARLAAEEAAAEEAARLAAEEAARQAAQAEADRMARIEAARMAIAAAATAEAAQMAYDAVKDEATATESAALMQAVADRRAALALMDSAAQQMMALAAAAVDVTTFDLTTEAGIMAAEAALAALQSALDAATDVSDADKAMYQSQLNAASLPVMTARAESDRMGRIAAARMAISTAATPEDAQMAFDAVTGEATLTEAEALHDVLQTRLAELATMDRANQQMMALSMAAGNIDLSDLTTQDTVNAASTAIAALEVALAAAVDVGDADKATYQATVEAGKMAVMTAQGVLDHAAQTMALANAVMDLNAIDLGSLTTQAAIDAAQAAIDAVQAALDAATELSDAEKAAALAQLATATRTVLMAQGRVDVAGQMAALTAAVMALEAIDLDNLMTQDDIDAANRAIAALDLALADATDLTSAQKLDATVDVTLAKRKVMAAETTLANNIQGQRDALMTASNALTAIDLTDLSDQAKIDAAETAINNLKMALDGATHLSEADKSMYQSQYDMAYEDVKTAKTGMGLMQRMASQRTELMNAMTAARTAVAGVSDDSTDSEVMAADSAITRLENAIMNAEDLPDGDTDVAIAQGTLDTLKGTLASAKTSRMMAMEEQDEEEMKAAAALGSAMRAALGPPDAADTTALNNIGTPVLASTGLTIDAATGAGALATADGDPPAVELTAGDSAGMLGSWNGMDYSRTTGTGDAEVTNEARVYTNQGMPRTRPFSGTGGVYTLVSGQTGADAVNNGYLGSSATTVLDVSALAADLAKVRSDAFTHSGTQTHQVPAESDAFYVSGTYDGAPGRFRCTTGCSSTNDGSGAPSALGGTWHFKPEASAMVSTPDDEYLFYGWWVRKDADGDPVAASAFAGVVEPTAGDLDNAGDLTVITGSATYVGNAAGKYSIANVLEGTGHGGHFTADAELNATFSSANANQVGITGTIDNFRLNDGTDDPGWSVALNRGGASNLSATAGGITAPADDTGTTNVDESLGTVWSINGNAAPASGTWSGTMYDEMPGDPPDGDGSNIPTTVTGTFYSEFSTIGRMVGGFGANKQ